MKFAFFASALFLFFQAHAEEYTCPDYKLTCELQKLNENLGFVTTKTLTAPFEAFNAYEPSAPADTCAAGFYFSESDTGLDVSYHALVTEDLDAYLFVGKDYGAKNPQFKLAVTPGKEFSLYNGDQQMVCVLK
ncbi:MAG: hypothetical protein H6623_08500 [Bdellovibrionaceae bacterium]|nr:hypothetical protein [Pseudobdellovibrionaceae bacterium]